MPTFEVAGAELNYRRDGAAGACFVLVHEIGGTLESWAAVAPLLADKFQVISYDQRGAGASSRIAGDFSIDTQVDDLRALIERLASPPCHVAGVAIGAALAARLAARHPELVQSLVLACPAPSVDAARVEYLAQRAAQVEREGMPATVDGSLANSYPPEVRRDPAVFSAYRARFLANDPKSYAAINRAFARFDATPDLAAIRCPTLVLAGTHDRLRLPDFVRGVAAKIPGAQYGEIDSGHIMPVQAPQALAKAMLAFYDSVAAKAP